ncbi:unnamed protein product [Gongylonema pulchrum]|uniref:Recep_L_domain domain-containing protein n=1 Tax=Gongylonema pulchrum TaxID=637853 RepID=A0A183EEX7_9BILA|nr:unnamed protein product [Gongylonema pulchrum]
MWRLQGLSQFTGVLHEFIFFSHVNKCAETNSVAFDAGILQRRSELEQLRAYNFTVGFSEQLDLCGIGVIHYLGIPNHIWISSCPMMESVSYNLGKLIVCSLSALINSFVSSS